MIFGKYLRKYVKLVIKGNNEDIVKPFLIACESKTTKLIVTALSSLHQLLLYGAVPEVGFCHHTHIYNEY